MQSRCCVHVRFETRALRTRGWLFAAHSVIHPRMPSYSVSYSVSYSNPAARPHTIRPTC
jgi:hypothetical protein